jgi:P pilus assembly chaperone PapD
VITMQDYNRIFCCIIATLLLHLVVIPTAQASISLQSSRVIFHAEARQSEYLISNSYDYPVLINSWVDDGNSTSPVKFKGAPVITYPASFKISPHSVATIKLINIFPPLDHKNQEALFWLNVQVISPQKKGASDEVNVATLTKLKLFYRPQGLSVTPTEAVNKVTFVSSQGGATLKVMNPTPYYFTFKQIMVGSSVVSNGFMIAPGEMQEINLSAPVKEEQKLNYSLIDDDGQTVTNEYKQNY